MLKIKLSTVIVNDQDKALNFYTEVLGFIKKADFSQGSARAGCPTRRRVRIGRPR